MLIRAFSARVGGAVTLITLATADSVDVVVDSSSEVADSLNDPRGRHGRTKTPNHRDQTMRSHRQPAVTKKEVELKQAKIEVEALQL